MTLCKSSFASSGYDDYVGIYQFRIQGNITFSIFEKDGNLYAQGQEPGQNEFEIFPVEKTKDLFYAKVAKLKIEFERDSKGNVIRLILHQHGDAPKAKKIE